MSVLVFIEDEDDLVAAGGHACAVARRSGAVAFDGPYAPARGRAAHRRAGGDDIVGPGSDRGNEVLAHVAAQLDLPFAANVTDVRGDEVTRQRWGGTPARGGAHPCAIASC